MPPGSAQSSIEGSDVSLPRCRAAIWSAVMPTPGLRIALPRADAVQPRLFDDAVRAGAFPALVAQTADDGHVLAQGFQGLEDERKIEIAAGPRRRPFLLERAVGKVHEAQTRAGCGDGLRQRRSCRDHRIQQRERDGRAGPLENLAPRQMFSRQERHDSCSTRCSAWCLVLGASSVLSTLSVRGPRS